MNNNNTDHIDYIPHNNHQQQLDEKYAIDSLFAILSEFKYSCKIHNTTHFTVYIADYNLKTLMDKIHVNKTLLTLCAITFTREGSELSSEIDEKMKVFEDRFNTLNIKDNHIEIQTIEFEF